MIDYLTFFSPLFAQAQNAPANPPAAPPSGSGFEILVFMLPVFFILYWFFMLRPQQKQEDRQRKMLDSLDKNDRVLTVGGIIATIHTVDKEKNEVVLKVDDSNGTKIKFNTSAILTVFPKDTDKTDAK